MASIYGAAIYCDGCIEEIKKSICKDLWEFAIVDTCPDGTRVVKFYTHEEIDDHLRSMDERHYDSDSYPKYCSDDQESDCPEHCAGGPECVNALVCANGTKVGYFFGNSLTSAGADYVREAVHEDIESGRTDSIAVEVWFPYYFWLDWGDIDRCEYCGKAFICRNCSDNPTCGKCLLHYDYDDPCSECDKTNGCAGCEVAIDGAG